MTQPAQKPGTPIFDRRLISVLVLKSERGHAWGGKAGKGGIAMVSHALTAASIVKRETEVLLFCALVVGNVYSSEDSNHDVQ